MSYPHSHSHSQDHLHSHSDQEHGHDGHSHDASDKPVESTPSSLHGQIDFPNVVALNSTNATPGRVVFKQHSEREDELVYVESDADDQIIFRVPFTASVKLKSIMIKTGPGEHTAERVLLFPNDDNLDFSDVQDKKPAQELECPQVREAVEYPVKAAKFSSCRSISIFFPSAVAGDTTRIYYIGFYGEWQPLQDKPVIAVYESKPQLADHPKIPGTDMGMNWGSH